MSCKHHEKMIAKLTSKVDHLETELAYLNRILVKAGFPEGIKTLKSSVEELLDMQEEMAPSLKKREL